jgi:hypothetical protein
MQVWDAQGRIVVDFTTRLSRVLGSTFINGTSGALGDGNLIQGQSFAIFQPSVLFQHISGDAPRPVITISGTTISWTYSGAASSHHTPVQGWLFYGVF